MSPLVIGIALLAIMNFAFKALGPLILEADKISERTAATIDAMGQGLLASLVIAALVGADGSDLDVVLVVAVVLAMILRWRGLPELVCVLVAVAVVAIVRSLM